MTFQNQGDLTLKLFKFSLAQNQDPSKGNADQRKAHGRTPGLNEA